jgi:hypothetical protein
MENTDNQVRINIEQYKKYRKEVGFEKKDGIFDVTCFPNGKYCFLTKQFLGDYGEVFNHSLLGKKILRVKEGKIFTVDNVCLHWDYGYYYQITAKDKNNSHTVLIVENLNSTEEWVEEGVKYFNDKYVVLN